MIKKRWVSRTFMTSWYSHFTSMLKLDLCSIPAELFATQIYVLLSLLLTFGNERILVLDITSPEEAIQVYWGLGFATVSHLTARYVPSATDKLLDALNVGLSRSGKLCKVEENWIGNSIHIQNWRLQPRRNLFDNKKVHTVIIRLTARCANWIFLIFRGALIRGRGGGRGVRIFEGVRLSQISQIRFFI